MAVTESRAPRLTIRRWRCAPYALFAALLVGAAGIPTASAFAHNDRDHDRDHDLARQAREAGEVLPLPAILARVERDYPGKILDVELERDHAGHEPAGRWVYKIKVLRSGGSLVKIKVDARDGAVMGTKDATRGGQTGGTKSGTGNKH